MKKCKKCGIEKPLIDFYGHPQNSDGHLNECKQCVRKRVAAREEKLRKDPKWCELERIRAKEKYHRLNYRELQTQRNRLKNTGLVNTQTSTEI